MLPEKIGLTAILKNVPDGTGKPVAVIAHTVKGKGVSFMENELLWHYKSPDESQYLDAVKELETNLWDLFL